MKIHSFTILAALLASPAFAQNILNTDYLYIQPQNNTGEGGELELVGSNGYGAFHIDNYHGHARIHTLAPGKQLQIVGGSIYADGSAVNFFASNLGIGSQSPRQNLEVGSASNPAINIHDFNTAELTFGINEQSPIAQFNTNSNGFRFVSGQDGLNFPGAGTEIVRFTSTGNVGIGTSNPAHKLAVNGTIKAKEVIVETTGWSDYVFADDYALQPLSQVEAHIKEHKHLPGIPSASKVASEGVNVGDIQAALLAKVEELTLHLIAQEKELARLRETEKDLAALRAEVRQLRQAK